MDVPLGWGIGVLVASLLLMFLVALTEVSLATVSRAHVRKLGEEGLSSALLIEALLKDIEHFLGGLLVWRTIAIGAATTTASWLVWQSGGNALHLLEAWIGIGLVLILIQVLGRSLAVRHPVSVAMRVVRPIRWLFVLVMPLVWIMLRLVQRIGVEENAKVRNIFLTEDGLRLLLNFGDEERFIEEEEREMINSIFRFSETTVEEVMVPRVDVVALEKHATLQEALDTIVEAGHSRIPIYDETIDKIIGVLYAKDLLTCFRDGSTDMPITQLMREPYFVPESAMVDDLLTDLQAKKTHLAIVVDEYGGTAGVVTIEDLLEEIVGEIQDEYDSEVPLLQKIGEGVYMASGRMNLDELNRELDLNLADEDESNTLAGLIYSYLQRVPDPGDALDLGNTHLEVVRVDDNRIEEVQIVLEGSNSNKDSHNGESTNDH
ncbi:MAG: HlyC/CorC family transporter [Chloroflexi bacterium]|nr:HlyC/CorC family transporter [Chloroflexota bacterium]